MSATHLLSFDHDMRGHVTRLVRLSEGGMYWQNVDSNLLYRVGPFTGTVFTMGHAGRIGTAFPVGTHGKVEPLPN